MIQVAGHKEETNLLRESLKLVCKTTAGMVQDFTRKMVKLEEKIAFEADRMQARVERCNRVVTMAIKYGD